MLNADFFVFLIAMVGAIVLLFMMVWHVSCAVHIKTVARIEGISMIVTNCGGVFSSPCLLYH